MDDYKYLDCYVGNIEEGKLYVASIFFGIVLEYDLEDFTYRVLTQINLSDPFQPVRVNSIIKSANFLYMTLWNSWNVFEYDIKNRQLKIYGNDFEYIDGKESTIKSHMYKDRIWIFPRDTSQKIRIFHIKKKEFEMGISVEEILNQEGYKVSQRSLVCLDVFHEKNKCVLGVYDSPYVVEINLETRKYNAYAVKTDAKIEIMSYVDGQYWISYTDSAVIEKWNPVDGILETYEPKKLYTREEWKYRYVFEYKEKVVIVPTNDRIICIIDKKTRQETVLECVKDIRRVHNAKRWMFYGIIKCKEKILLLPFSLTYFIVIDLQNEQLELYHSKFDVDVIKEYWIKPRVSERILWENNVFDLSKYLDCMLEYSVDKEECISRMGEKIWIQLR